MSLKNKIPPPIVGLIFMGIIYLSRSLTSPFIIEYQTIIAAEIAVFGLVVILTAGLQFKRHKTTVNPLKPETASSLVSDGIFKFSRNPMYLGMLCFLISAGVYLGAWSSVVIIPMFIIYMNEMQIKPEEQAIEQLFGDDYILYKKSVRRWI